MILRKIVNSSSKLEQNNGQAIKGYWWMPWHQQAKKDAKPAKSFGELEKSNDPEISEWGNPIGQIAYYPCLNT
jgi:hypothetical protein